MPPRAWSGPACCRLGAFGFGTGGAAMALPTRDFGCFVAFTFLPLRRVSSLFAKKLVVFEKVLISLMAWSSCTLPEAFSITSIRWLDLAHHHPRQIPDRRHHDPHVKGELVGTALLKELALEEHAGPLTKLHNGA